MAKAVPDFRPLNIHVLTVTDTRSYKEDGSGDYLCQAAEAGGHKLVSRDLCRDDLYDIRARVATAIADAAIDVVLVTGGTGMFPRDVTPDAVSVLLDKDIPGFGELFRAVSYEEIGMSTIQSRALAGIANQTLVFCLPGSTGACRTAWEKVIAPQLDPRINACGFTRVFNTWSAAQG
ncbi:molybdenum cofactor biosynthesis protein B [Neisseria sp. HSC-16F19]|nr:molybdenum cofactor biosynthesis protein B [Neisseria sp. HSC-16F19]MCP2039787.1 molybdenum cofactor biosynthesis protein B [Neisseria sp. HSC-16F19]